MYFKAKTFHMEIIDDVLTYRLINNANFTKEHKLLVKATVSKMDYQIMKDHLKKVFTSTSTNVYNKTDVDKMMSNQRKMRYFIHQEIRITDNKIVLEDPSVGITKILKIKITIKKWIDLKGKFQDATFVGQNFIGKKTVQMPLKNMIYDCMTN